MSRTTLLECCVESVESAIAAKEGGANRLELCTGLLVGGLSPTPSLFKAVRKAVGDMKINVLLRPRAGDFLYSNYEFDILKDEVRCFKELGADGIVIGILQPDGSLDSERLSQLIAIAGGGMHLTLHRAVDMTKDPKETLEEAARLGFDTILTSGQAESGLKGKALLRELAMQASGRIAVMAGGGINAEVLRTLHPFAKLPAYHMSGKKQRESGMVFRQPKVSMGTDENSEYLLSYTDQAAVKAAREALDFL